MLLRVSSRLHIWPVQDSHAGRYQCVATNQLGSTYSTRAVVTVNGMNVVIVDFVCMCVCIDLLLGWQEGHRDCISSAATACKGTSLTRSNLTWSNSRKMGSGQKYSGWILNTYTCIAQKAAIFAEKNSKIASLMSCQRSDLRKTLKYSQSWTPLFNFWIPYCKSQMLALVGSGLEVKLLRRARLGQAKKWTGHPGRAK